MDLDVRVMQPILTLVVEEVAQLQQIPNGEVGLPTQHVEVIALDQDQDHVLDLHVKDILHTSIHAQEEVALPVASGVVGHLGQHVEVTA